MHFWLKALHLAFPQWDDPKPAHYVCCHFWPATTAPRALPIFRSPPSAALLPSLGSKREERNERGEKEERNLGGTPPAATAAPRALMFQVGSRHFWLKALLLWHSPNGMIQNPHIMSVAIFSRTPPPPGRFLFSVERRPPPSSQALVRKEKREAREGRGQKEA